MKVYDKIYIGIFVLWVITIILSYCIDWPLTNNGFTSIAMWLMFLITGLSSGRILTLKKVKK